MKNSQYSIFYAVAIFCALASCSTSTSSVSDESTSSSTKRDSALADQVFKEVNSYRASKGKAPLLRHTGLDQLAQQHSDYLAKTGGNYGLHGKTVSHIGFDRRAMTAKQAYKIKSFGENVIASTDRSAKRLVDHWVASEGHNHNMISDWSYTGIGSSVNSEGKIITTQIFGAAPSTSHREMADRFRNQW